MTHATFNEFLFSLPFWLDLLTFLLLSIHSKQPLLIGQYMCKIYLFGIPYNTIPSSLNEKSC
uniref:RxLR effector candidate protein n=1 Tax=Hyaloperonospora arabidopsidis (strain Emoy2) TaxID=559515 RepID=M4BUJ3_HYAAE